MNRYLVTQLDSEGRFYAHTVCDWDFAPDIVRSNGRLFIVSSGSLIMQRPGVFEVEYNEISEANIKDI